MESNVLVNQVLARLVSSLILLQVELRLQSVKDYVHSSIDISNLSRFRLESEEAYNSLIISLDTAVMLDENNSEIVQIVTPKYSELIGLYDELCFKRDLQKMVTEQWNFEYFFMRTKKSYSD